MRGGGGRAGQKYHAESNKGNRNHKVAIIAKPKRETKPKKVKAKQRRRRRRRKNKFNEFTSSQREALKKKTHLELLAVRTCARPVRIDSVVSASCAKIDGMHHHHRGCDDPYR